MQNKESVRKNSIKTIKMYLSEIHTEKQNLYYLRESRVTERADLKSLYLFDQIERDGRKFRPLDAFSVLQSFMQKDKQRLTWRILDKEINSLSPEQLSEEYCNFVAEETRKAIRERIKELDEEIEVEKVEKREAEEKKYEAAIEKNIVDATINKKLNITPGNTQGNTAVPNNSTPGKTNLSTSDNSTKDKAAEEVHLNCGSFKKKRPSSSILDGTPPTKKRVRFAGAE